MRITISKQCEKTLREKECDDAVERDNAANNEDYWKNFLLQKSFFPWKSCERNTEDERNEDILKTIHECNEIGSKRKENQCNEKEKNHNGFFLSDIPYQVATFLERVRFRSAKSSESRGNPLKSSIFLFTQIQKKL